MMYSRNLRQTEAVGLTPEQVEVLVTRPIENAISGVPGVRTLRSTSIQGLSVVTVFFDPSSDIYRDRQVVAERLAAATQQLPQGLQPPVMTPLASSTSRMLVVGVTSETRSLMELRTVAEDGPLAPSRRSRRRQRHRVRGATSARSRSRCIPTNSSDTA
jgi:Cu/Ag efflux pump CusA